MNPVPRRRLPRLLAVLGLAAAGGLLALAFAPLPVGWAINAFAPDDPAPRVRVGAATLRLRPFGDGPALDIRRLAVDQGPHPLVRLETLRVTAQKSALLSGRLAAVVEGDGLEASLPPASADNEKPSPAPPPPDVPALLAELLPRLAADPRALIVTLRSVRIQNSDTKAPPLPSLSSLSLVLGPRPDGTLAARVELAAAAPGVPVVGLDAVIAADHRRAEVGLGLPSVELASLAALAPVGTQLPVAGRVAVRAHAALDLVKLAPLGAWLELDCDELRPAVTHPFAPPPASLRVRLRANETLDGLVAERFTLVAPGLDFSLPRMEAKINPALDAAELVWGLHLAVDPAVAWPEEAKRQIAALPPELAALGAELRGISAAGEGAASLRLRDGAWVLATASVKQSHEARLGPTTLRADIAARQDAPDTPVTISLTIPEVHPAGGRAAGDASPLAAFDFPFAAKVDAELTPALRLASARVRANAGPGRMLPFGALRQEVILTELDLEAHTADAKSVQVDKLRLVSGDTRLIADGTSATRRDDGLVELDLQLDAAVPKPADWTAFFPVDLGEALKPLGWSLTDIGLEQLAVVARATLAPDAPERAIFRVETSARLRIGRDAVAVAVDARREEEDGPVHISATVPSLNPSRWPGRPDPSVAWADLQLPVSVLLDGHLAAPNFAPHIRLNVEAGPGSITAALPELNGAVVVFEKLAVEASMAGDPLLVQVPSATLRLGRGVELGASEVRLDLRKDPVIDGRFRMEAFGLVDALGLWPVTVEPELRARVVRHVREGRVERAEGRFGVDLPAGGAAVLRVAEADFELAGLVAAGPELPWPVSVGKLGAELRWPRASLSAEGLRVPGAEVKTLRGRVADLTAAVLAVGVELDFAADLAALPKEAAMPAGYTGRVSGNFSAEARVRADVSEPETVTFSGNAAVVDFRIPELVGGAVAVRFSGTADSTRKAELALELDGSGLAWTPPELQELKLHPELNVSVQAALDAALRPMRAELSVATPELLGPAFALKAGATWAAGEEMPGRVDLTELAWGRTRLTGDYQTTTTGPRVAVRASMIDVPELWGVARPLLATPAATEQPSAASVANTAAAASPLANLGATLAVERVNLGGGRLLQGIEVSLACDAKGEPDAVSFTAREGESNRLTASLRTAADGLVRTAEVTADDVPRWAGALAAPFREKPAPGDWAPLVGNLETVAGLLAGGSLSASASMPVDQTKRQVTASAVIRNTTLVRFPRVIQMLALKSGKGLRDRPLVSELRVGEVSLAGEQIKVGGVLLVGSGLIDRLKVNAASYALDTDVIAADGSYFGVGFEVDGTRAKPEVWLKDNLVIRAIGQTSDLDFGE